MMEDDITVRDWFINNGAGDTAFTRKCLKVWRQPSKLKINELYCHPGYGIVQVKKIFEKNIKQCTWEREIKIKVVRGDGLIHKNGCTRLINECSLYGKIFDPARINDEEVCRLIENHYMLMLLV